MTSFDLREEASMDAMSAAYPSLPARAPRIIALCGRKRSGKDTAAHALSRYGYRPIAFAEPLKAMLVGFLAANGMSSMMARAHVYGDHRETPLPELNGRSIRHALQTLGTEWGRDLIHPDLWRDATMRRIAAAPGQRFVITDMRFPNEADAVRAAGGVIVRLVRPATDESGADFHVSEQLLEEIQPDYWLHNISESAERFSGIVLSFYQQHFA